MQDAEKLWGPREKSFALMDFFLDAASLAFDQIRNFFEVLLSSTCIYTYLFTCVYRYE